MVLLLLLLLLLLLEPLELTTAVCLARLAAEADVDVGTADDEVECDESRRGRRRDEGDAASDCMGVDGIRR
jgi:hypothetical protein